MTMRRPTDQPQTDETPATTAVKGKIADLSKWQSKINWEKAATE